MSLQAKDIGTVILMVKMRYGCIGETERTCMQWMVEIEHIILDVDLTIRAIDGIMEEWPLHEKESVACEIFLDLR